MDFRINISTATNAMAKILQFEAIADSSYVFFGFRFDYEPFQIELPVDAITNWLNRTYNPISSNGKANEARILKIQINAYILNVSEILNCLKKVNFNYKFTCK